MENAAANAFCNIVMGRLVLEIDKRYKMMKDLKRDTEFIIEELDLLSAHMDDQLMRRDAPRTEVARLYSKKMRDWTHDMEDCIELFLHPVTCKVGASRFSRIRWAAHRVKTLRSRYQFATRINKFKKRLEEARDRIKKLPGSDQFSAELNPLRRGSDPAGRKPAVGMAKPKGDLLALLEDQQQQLMVISIVGFGGSGKTTLARAAYDDTDVVGKFPCRAWVAYNPRMERSDATGILRYIQQELLPDQRYSETSLTEYLQDKRYLVVIDGVGDVEAEQWDTITSILEKNGRGSRIIVTTTFRSAANRCSSGSGYVYKMRSLGNEYCMEIALGKRRTQELVEGSTTLLKKCDGLPLALVSVANQLKSEDEPTGRFCTKLCRRLGSYLEREVDDDEPNFARLRGVLADNYTGLSNHTVRACLLYLCIFPNDRPLRRNVVIRRWLAEGYARSEHLDSLEVADANFDTFINWNIIQPVATSDNEVTKACKTQGIMHEFLLQKSISEKFIVSSRGPSLKTVRHLSVHDRDATSSTTTLDMDLSRVRSLTVSGSAGDAISGFGRYKLMRVLDLEECSDVNDGHLKDICKLWNLRYLSLGARITMLPKEIAKLKLLETLHLSKTTVNVLPVEVIGLPCLIHLIGKFKLPDQEPVSSGLEQLSKGSNLETLAGYVASDQSQVFPQLMVHMKKLRKVKIWCEFTGGSGSNSTDHLSRAIREYMRAHQNDDDVRSLSIDFQKCSESEQLQNFLHSLEAPCYLSSLKLHGKLLTLPPFVAYAKDLIQLCLSSTTLTQDVLSAVSNLENLKKLLYLKLIADHLDNFVIPVGAFQILRRLRFVVRGPNPILPEIQDRALPELVSLQLICEHLAGLSNIEIRHLTSLKEVTLDSRVTTETRGAWEAAAWNHPKRPNVLLFEMVDDPTGNATENPVAAPEEAAPDQTAMQGQIAEEGSEPPAVHMNSLAQSSPRDSKTTYIEKLFQRNQQLQLASQGTNSQGIDRIARPCRRHPSLPF